MNTIKINIVSASEEIYSGEATMVYAMANKHRQIIHLFIFRKR